MTVLFSFPVLESPEEVLAMLNSECREDEASRLLKWGGGEEGVHSEAMEPWSAKSQATLFTNGMILKYGVQPQKV